MKNISVTNQGGGYQPWISILRITATVCVVWLHTCSTLAENTDVFQMTDWQHKFFNAGYQMMYWAVPVFFMITGALLLNPEKKITPYDCAWRYGRRILLALLIFGIPFAAIKYAMENRVISIILLPLSLKAVLENQSFDHLWYLYSLIGIYLILPILRSFVENASESEGKLVIIALAVLDFLVPLVNNLTGLDTAFEIPLKYLVLYVLLGWYLSNTDTRKYRKAGVVTIILIIAVIWMLNYTVDNASGWTGYNSPLILVLAALMFVTFRSFSLEGVKTLWKVDRLCFAVYLIHPCFIHFTYRYLRITPTKFIGLYPIVTMGFFIVFVTSSFIGSWILSKVKPLKKYVL